jgi:hypothetical protein
MISVLYMFCFWTLERGEERRGEERRGGYEND